MTDIVGNETVRSVWERLVVSRGSHPFLIFEDRQGRIRDFTYRRFAEEIDKTANLFLDLGIEKGECVAVHTRTSPEFMMCLFGLAKIGAVIVPVHDQSSRDECEYVLTTCKVVCAVVDGEFLEMYRTLRAQGISLEKGLISIDSKPYSPCSKMDYVEAVKESKGDAEDARRLEGGTENFRGAAEDFTSLKDAQPSFLKKIRPLSSDDLVEILFTSGTTACPKGVELTHANLVFSGIYGAWEVALDKGDRMLSTMPACHSNFQLAALTPVMEVGATLIAIEKYSARKFWHQIRGYKATLTQGVAMMLRTLMLQPRDPDEQDHFLREILYFLPVTDDEKAAFEERYKVRLLNTYGSTESVVWVLTDRPHAERKWPSVGRVGLTYDVKIADERGRELEPLSIGEIMVKGIPGRTLMRGYHRDPNATARAIDEQGWMRTGDKGYQDESGWFYFVDRKVNMIKRSGENISATEIESVLVQHPAIAEAAVIGVPDPIRDQAVKAFVLPKEGATLTETDVLEYCRKHLATFKVPSYIEIRKDFPRTCSMKIEKKLLR